MAIKESSLLKQTTMAGTDLIRIIGNAASRNITLSNFASAISTHLTALGFLTTSNLPVATANSHVVTVVSTSTNMDADVHDVLLVDCTAGNVAINLPSVAAAWDNATSKGQMFIIKKKDVTTNKVIISTLSSDTIDGMATAEILGPGKGYIRVISDGSNWWTV